MVLITPLNNLLPRYAEAITGGDGKEAALAWVSGLGRCGSDGVQPPSRERCRTAPPSALGRRRPWIVGGALVAAGLDGGHVVSGQHRRPCPSAWFLVLAAANMAFSAMTAYIPDQVPGGPTWSGLGFRRPGPGARGGRGGGAGFFRRPRSAVRARGWWPPVMLVLVAARWSWPSPMRDYPKSAIAALRTGGDSGPASGSARRSLSATSRGLGSHVSWSGSGTCAGHDLPALLPAGLPRVPAAGAGADDR